MSLKHIVWAWKAQGIESPTVRFVLLALADQVRDHMDSCFPSQKTLADMTQLSPDTISRAVCVLETLGHIRIERSKKPDGSKSVNIYHFPTIEITASFTKKDDRKRAKVVPAQSRVDCQGVPAGDRVPTRTESEEPGTLPSKEQQHPLKVPQGGRKAPAQTPIGEEKYSGAFEAFWMTYPKAKAGSKWEAWKRWSRLKLDKLTSEQRAAIIADVIERQKRHRAWLDGYIPHASTYLNARGWTAEIDTTPPGNGHDSKFDEAQRIANKHRERLESEWNAAGGGDPSDDTPL